MIPDPSSTAESPLAGGKGNPAGHVPPVRARPGHIQCAVCDRTIHVDEYPWAVCWTDPTSVTCAAHRACLVRLGEYDLGLGAA